MNKQTTRYVIYWVVLMAIITVAINDIINGYIARYPGLLVRGIITLVLATILMIIIIIEYHCRGIIRRDNNTALQI